MKRILRRLHVPKSIFFQPLFLYWCAEPQAENKLGQSKLTAPKVMDPHVAENAN